MTNAQTGSARPTDSGAQWLTTIASLVVGTAFFTLWFWLLPNWLGFQADAARSASWRWLAAYRSVLGFAVAVRCVWDFGHTGRGTPAPFAPPQRLVVVGFYRYVRNPMYLGFITGWIGLWIVFGRANWSVIAGAATVVLGVACLCGCMKSRICERCSAPTMKNIAATCAAGCHGCGPGSIRASSLYPLNLCSFHGSPYMCDIRPNRSVSSNSMSFLGDLRESFAHFAVQSSGLGHIDIGQSLGLFLSAMTESQESFQIACYTPSPIPLAAGSCKS